MVGLFPITKKGLFFHYLRVKWLIKLSFCVPSLSLILLLINGFYCQLKVCCVDACEDECQRLATKAGKSTLVWDDMERNLTSAYNRERQAKITEDIGDCCGS